MSKSVLIVCVVAITILASPFNVMMTVHSLTPCEEALNALKPCVSYLHASPGVPPTPECCKSLDNVNRSVKTFDNHRDMHICLSTAATISSASDPNKFVTLPQLCPTKKKRCQITTRGEPGKCIPETCAASCRGTLLEEPKGYCLPSLTDCLCTFNCRKDNGDWDPPLKTRK
ncbi:unnamed protein product, partial [Thlaspi arvense]